VNFACLARIDDSADFTKSKIGGRVAVANRTCPTVIVSVHPTVWSTKHTTSMQWYIMGKKGPVEETSTYVTLIWDGIPQAREFGTCARSRSV